MQKSDSNFATKDGQNSILVAAHKPNVQSEHHLNRKSQNEAQSTEINAQQAR